jgi:hypothetical protein
MLYNSIQPLKELQIEGEKEENEGRSERDRVEERERGRERVKKGPICYVNVLVDRGKKWTAKLSLDRHG